jgi:MraZ protein
MFIGEYHHTIDEKGRLSVPKKFRGELEKGLVITKGLDGCLFIYTNNEWEKMSTKLNSLPLTNKNAREFKRHMTSGAMDLEIDGQGRVILPEYLREFAGIKKNVVVAGIAERIEIWDEVVWNKHASEIAGKTEEIAESMDGLGI